MDEQAVNPIRPILSRLLNACDNAELPGTSSRRTQLFTFQGAIQLDTSWPNQNSSVVAGFF